MNVHQHHGFARFDGLDALAGYDDRAELAGIGKKLKKLHKKVSKASVGKKVFEKSHKLRRKLEAKTMPKKLLNIHQKTEKFVKRNALTVAGAVATVATGGAAAPALVAALQKTAASEAMRKIAKKRGQKQRKKMIGKANAEADRQAAQYEAELERQDAARASATASTGGGGAADPSQPDAATPDTPKRSGWILPTLGIGAAALALV